MRDIDAALEKRARAMRRDMTKAERRLWRHMRQRLPLERTHFRRQLVIGAAIVDFACVANKLIIEVDGAQHGEDEARAYDDARTQALVADGWRVLRFWNFQVMDEIDSVIETIAAVIEGRL